MGLYTDLLAKNNNTPIWQWEFSDELIAEIKSYFVKAKSLSFIDSRDCALFFAIWWKEFYSDGIPSKQLIYDTLKDNGHLNFLAEDFYQKAKQGGRAIGLKWIKKDNTLYLRTLLLHGGLPIKNMMANAGNYSRFLDAILELKPETIEDIANNLSIISLLPFSSRNENIYATALNISIAIHKGEGDWYVEKLVAAKVITKNIIDDAVNRSRNRRNNLIRIRPFWELIKSHQDTAIISLRIDLPERLEKNAFASLINIIEGDLKTSYNFFSDENLVASYRKNLRGDFLKSSSNYHPISWNPENDQLPSIYFADNNGNKYFLQNKIVAMPSLVEPTLWLQMEENRWVMSQKSSHNGDSAFLLTAKNHVAEENHPCIVVEGNQFCFYEINETISLEIDGNDFTFSLNTIGFDWNIQSNAPRWINRSSMVVINSLTKIHFYTDNGTHIPDNQIIRQWRKKGSLAWRNDYLIGQYIDEGVIEFKFTYGNISEYFKVFNIGNADLTLQAQDVIHPVLTFKQPYLRFAIKDSPLYSKNVEGKSICLAFKYPNQIPNLIKAVIWNGLEKLNFELITPTIGESIVDKEDNVLNDGHVFLLKNLYGYRIVLGNRSQTIKLYNERHPTLYINQELKNGLISLQSFNETIEKLFLLNDPMFSNNRVIMQIGEKTFNFQAYNLQLKYKDNFNNLILADDRLVLTLKDNKGNDFLIDESESVKLKAIPLNCDLVDIEIIDLEKNGIGYSIPSDIISNEFIVFDDFNDFQFKILPTYFTTLKQQIITDSEILKNRKIERIDKFANILQNEQANGDEWQKINAYINLSIENELPFSAFDSLRAAVSSSELTAKLFLFIACNASSNEKFFKTCEKMEDELGFKFRWCSYEAFNAAINWVFETWQVDFNYLFSILGYYVEYKYLSFESSHWVLPNGFSLNVAKRELGQRLGETVINELPIRRPWIEENLKEIISTDQERLKIIMRTPIAIALQKMNLYVIPENNGQLFSLWHVNNYEARRNMIYCENLDLIWFEIALKYVFKYLQSNNLIQR